MSVGDQQHIVVAPDCIDTKIDVGVLKQQITTLTLLCDKMDKVIEKLVDQHDRHIAKVYTDMESRRKETESDIKELHERIDTVLDKVQASELRLMEELKALRKEMQDHNNKEKESLDKLLQWKWMVAGGIVVISWLVSHINIIDMFLKK
jgi:chromosome segregation ATPase